MVMGVVAVDVPNVKPPAVVVAGAVAVLAVADTGAAPNVKPPDVIAGAVAVLAAVAVAVAGAPNEKPVDDMLPAVGTAATVVDDDDDGDDAGTEATTGAYADDADGAAVGLGALQHAQRDKASALATRHAPHFHVAPCDPPAPNNEDCAACGCALGCG